MLYEDLFEISKLLLAEDDAERAPEVLLRRLVERCGAETGFVVVREDGSYQQKLRSARSAAGAATWSAGSAGRLSSRRSSPAPSFTCRI